MSIETGPHRSGNVYISPREIYDKVDNLEMEVVKFKVWFSVIGIVIGPLVSTFVAALAMNLMNGK